MKHLLRMTVACLVAGLAHPVSAFDAFVVKKIRLEGLQRISESTVYNYLPIEVGDTLSDEKSTEVIQALFKTEFFQDVQVLSEDDTLIVQLKERPAIGSLKISGNQEMPTDELMKTLKQLSLVEGQAFNRATIDLLTNDLEKMYRAQGRYAIQIETKVTDLPRNRVAIEIMLVEGPLARIQNINIVGNHSFSQKALKQNFVLSRSNFLSFYSKDDVFDRYKLGKDLDSLQSFYMDRGYLQFQILSTPISISRDKKNLCLTISVAEGKPYNIKDLKIEGDEAVTCANLSQYLVFIRKGAPICKSQLMAVAKLMMDNLSHTGYAFAKVTPMPTLDEEKHEVCVTFLVEPGEKVTVRHIDFEGNAKTEDTVLRHHLVQMEGTLASTPKIEAGKDHLNRTGFFNEVEVVMRPIPDRADQLDVLYKVTEVSSGTLKGGLGYSTADGLLLNLNASNRNIFGTGKTVDLGFDYNRAHTSCNLSYNDPFYTLDGVSRGFGLFYTKTALGNSAPISHYNTDVYGATMNYGIPINEYQRLTFAGSIQNTKLMIPKVNAPTEMIKFLKDYQGVDNLVDYFAYFKEVNFALSWTYNSLDRFTFPTKGVYQNLGIQWSAPFSDLQYYKINYNAKYYRPIFGKFVALAIADFGYGNGYGKTKHLPFFKNYYLGGARNLRGYEECSLGPRDSKDKPFGGNFTAVGTAVLILPSFSPSIRLALFADVGQVYQTPAFIGGGTNMSEVKYSVGGSVTWISPLGPIVVNVAHPFNPVNPGKQDQVRNFSITFGTIF